MTKMIQLWHGGRDLESDYRSPKQPRKNRWEHGPGLYLTTHYETARDYASGGGKTYQVSIELGNNIKNIEINLDEALNFIQDYVVGKKKQVVIDDIHNNLKRLNKTDTVNAEVFLNLLFNHDALKGEKILKLNRFLVEHNVDFGLVNNFKGRDETVMVIFNLQKIKKVRAVPAKEVSLDEYVIDVSNLEELNPYKNKMKNF